MLEAIGMSQPFYMPAMRQSSASISVRGSVVEPNAVCKGGRKQAPIGEVWAWGQNFRSREENNGDVAV